MNRQWLKVTSKILLYQQLVLSLFLIELGLDNILRKAFKLQMEARMEARMSRLQTAQTPSLMDSSDGSYKSAQTLPRVSEVSNLNRGPRYMFIFGVDIILTGSENNFQRN